MAALELPSRYEPQGQLGRGGGGEVWAVRDRQSGERYALKVLALEASEREMAALVREAVALSGLEGLGLPRIVRFGRLSRSGRAFLVRELVEGQSLEQVIAEGALEPALDALARAADQLTVLHRAGLLHGDVKPANVIVGPGGRTTFVDLGLAAPFREGGTPAEGLTPRYAAPELFQGKPLTVRAEVYALGVALTEALALGRSSRHGAILSELTHVAARATLADPTARFPSVDEFASALRRAGGLRSVAGGGSERAGLWPIIGMDATFAALSEAVRSLAAGGVLRVVGPPGSGRSALLRRLAWSLGVQGRPLVWLDGTASAASIATELAEHSLLSGVTVLVDAADALEPDGFAQIKSASAHGARVVVVGEARIGVDAREFAVPPLDEQAVADLARRAVPSLTPYLLQRLVEVSAGRPGPLQKLVRLIASEAVVSAADIERVLGSVDSQQPLPVEPIERASYFLDHGRFNDAKAVLDSISGPDEKASFALVIARARLELGLGEAETALKRLDPLLARDGLDDEEKQTLALYLARSHIGAGGYARALELLEPLLADAPRLASEALSFRAMALSMQGRQEAARAELERALAYAAEAASPRLEALAQASLALCLQRSDQNDRARAAYEHAIAAAERAGDAGMLSTIELNLAGLFKVRGDIARAMAHFEAALDMARRSGRRSTADQALLNLANTDLYLGRLARARASIDVLTVRRDKLPGMLRAQLLGIEAELALKQGNLEQSVELYDACADAYEALGRGMDAAEARLEGVLAAARAPRPDLVKLRRALALADEELGDSLAHRPLRSLATARVSSLGGDELKADQMLALSLESARSAVQKEWLWRALEARAELREGAGQSFSARRDREEALSVLEEIGARLPRDLREVYWNDPRRRSLRESVPGALATAETEFVPFNTSTGLSLGVTGQATGRISATTSVSQVTSTPLEQRLARILEVNSQLVGELDLGRLTMRITDYAVALARAERGFVLLKGEDGALTVHTSRSRAGDDPHAEFSKSIAESVISTGEPVVTLNARSDARMASFASVHQMLLESVACVPILAPSGGAIGALYVETRLRPAAQFERELPTLRAFADQVAIALENARLINENKRRADELGLANAELEEAHSRLRELLEGRTEQLKRARKKLRDARDALYGHFGYQGLVGTSAAMRRVYALVDRVKDADIPVLITGESGTGKELVARAIHDASARGKARMLGVNCNAIPENLLESELFGHVRGAFTGADRDRKGLFRECQGGSILLDEIGEIPLKMQTGLLRVLQERVVRPVGGTREEPIDARILFATHRDLAQLVAAGKFREDLYYRIHVVEIRLPSLRERSEDIPQLVDHFLGLFAARYKREKKSVSKEALRRLAEYDWPGNVRQLEHVLLNAWVLSDELELEATDFEMPDAWSDPAPELDAGAELDAGGLSEASPLRKGSISQHRRDERERMVEALRACNWNRVKAAELSGIPRRTFYRRLREYGIQ